MSSVGTGTASFRQARPRLAIQKADTMGESSVQSRLIMSSNLIHARSKEQAIRTVATPLMASSVRPIAAAIAVSWLGEVAHNAISLPLATLLGPETIAPGAVSLALGLAYARRPGSRTVLAGLIGWGSLNFAGGAILSVLPLGIFGFVPDQTVQHYLAHTLYGAAQIPLIWLSWRALRTRDGAA